MSSPPPRAGHKTSILTKTAKMRLEMEIDGDVMILRPIGVIDEDVNFSAILTAISDFGFASKTVQIDLGHVVRVNSCGVREWLLLMERATGLVTFVFTQVSQLFIEQANMIPSIFGGRAAAAGRSGSLVLSFQAPYFCSQCDSSDSIVITPEQVRLVNGQQVAPIVPCRRCGKQMEFDWIEDEYFSFLKRL